MKKIGIISDTHSHWDARYEKYFAGCDEIWHAGDVGDISIAERLSEIAPLRCVSGNIDHGEVRRRFRDMEVFKCEGLTDLQTHIAGRPGRYNAGIASLVAECGVSLLVCGHSHILRIAFDPRLNALYLNPGAAGVHGWQKVRTLVTLEIDGADMRNCNVIELRASLPTLL